MLKNNLTEYELALIEGLKSKKRRQLAKSITHVENDFLATRPFMGVVHQQFNRGQSDIIGITGPPGAGKSTLTGQLIKHYRSQGFTLGVILVDPSSPFTGGAILGDRIRMSEASTDPHVFIRSMGSRGRLGGLSAATQDAIKLMDAYGFDKIIVETVGIGQSETEIVETADISVVVSVPGLGDDIQILKAGVMEIGDLFVVNKADRDGAERVVTEINMLLDLAPKNQFRPPVVKTVSTRGEGIDLLAEALEKVKEHALESGQWDLKREERMFKELEINVQAQINRILKDSSLYLSKERLIKDLTKGHTDAYTEAITILKEMNIPLNEQQKGE
jgi:LAO/AO transport system kinase